MSDPAGQVDTGRITHIPQMHREEQWKHPVRVATTANGTLSTAFDDGSTIDGVTLATGDRILIKNQTDQKVNGIYVVNASGAPSRTYDSDIGPEFPGAAVLVREGSTNAGTMWYCTNLTDPVLGTDNVTWSALGGGGGGAPTTADYLVGTSQAGLSAEIVVGTTPGGELGNTWASPTVDSTHSGSAHTDFIAKTAANAKGDIFTATANDTPAVLTVGTDDQVLMAESGETTGLKWVSSQTPVTQDFSDVAAQGTADTYARGDHKHGMPADPGGSGGSVSVEAIYGDGNDSSATISVNTTLLRDMFYTDLTVNTGIVLSANGNRIFVKGTLTLTGTGKISGGTGGNGGNGGNGTVAAGGSAGSGGATVSGNSVPTSVGGRIGQVGGFNSNGLAGSASTQSSMGIAHAISGAGGNAPGRTGGAGAAAAGTNDHIEKPVAYPYVISWRGATGNQVSGPTTQGIAPSAGSGAGNPSAGGGGSGGSGGGGGWLVVCAKTITGTGNMESIGGAGGNGGNGFATAVNTGGGAGGSGGAGGVIVLLYKDKTGWSGSTLVTGGAGGTHGNGAGTGTNGADGTQGPSGLLYVYKMG